MAVAGAMLGLVAVVSPALAIAGAAAVAFVMLVVSDLTAGVAVFTFVSFLEVLPGFGSISAAKLAGGVLVIAWIAVSATSPGARRQFAAVHPSAVVLGIVFLAWVGLGMLWAESPGQIVGALTRYVPNMLLFPVVFAAVRQGRDVRMILLAFVAGSLVSTAYGTFIAPGDLDAAAEGRISGAATDPNYLATWLVAGMAVCTGALLTRAYTAALRMACAATLLVLLVALVATASRTGIVAVTGAAIGAVVVAGQGRRFVALAVAVVVLGFGAAYIAYAAPANVRARLQEVSGGSGRTDIWKVGVRMARANSLHGVGAGNFRISSAHYLLAPGPIKRGDLIIDTPKVAHNVYLEYWAELGVIGLGLFLALVGFAVRCGIRAARAFQRAGDLPMELLSRSVVVAIFGMFTGAFFVSIEYEKPIWLTLALCPALLALSARAEAR